MQFTTSNRSTDKSSKGREYSLTDTVKFFLSNGKLINPNFLGTRKNNL